MKVILLLSALAATIVVATASFQRVTPPRYINRPTLPPPRYRREANPNPQGGRGSLSATVNKPLSGPERRPSYNIDYQHNIWQGRNGQISAGGGLQKFPGQRWEPQVGIRGTWRFRREANPKGHGSVSATRTQALDGPERRPSYKVDYQHNIWQGKNGQLSAGGGAQKLPGGRWEPQVGIQGVYQFG